MSAFHLATIASYLFCYISIHLFRSQIIILSFCDGQQVNGWPSAGSRTQGRARGGGRRRLLLRVALPPLAREAVAINIEQNSGVWALSLLLLSGGAAFRTGGLAEAGAGGRGGRCGRGCLVGVKFHSGPASWAAEVVKSNLFDAARWRRMDVR